jgi:hypothetical protein
MIRPVTVFCGLLALGSGFYLYHAKHEVELIDKHIDRIAAETGALRADSRRLLDEWIRLGEPEQLHRYSDQYLGLTTIAPTQFARLGDLGNRLPPPRVEPPDAPAGGGGEDGSPSSQAAMSVQGTTDAGGGSQADDEDLPIPPIPPVLAASLAGSTGVDASRSAAPPPAKVAAELPGADEFHAAGQTKPLPAKQVDPRVADDPRALGQKMTPPKSAAPGAGPIMPDGQTLSQAVGQAFGPGPLALANKGDDIHIADSGATGPRRDARPTQSQPADPRGQMAQIPQRSQFPPQPGGQAQDQTPPARSPRQVQLQPPQLQPSQPQPQARMQAAPPGSLLGMSRGAAPVPLPAPMPVSATWPGR